MSVCFDCLGSTYNYLKTVGVTINNNLKFIFNIDDLKENTKELDKIIIDNKDKVYITSQPQKINDNEILWDILSVDEN